MRNIAISVSVCLSVCLLAYLKNNMPTVHQSFRTCYLGLWLGTPLSDGNSIRCVFCGPTSGFADHITFSRNMEQLGQNQRGRVCFVRLARWWYWGRSLPFPIASCFVVCNIYPLPVQPLYTSLLIMTLCFMLFYSNRGMVVMKLCFFDGFTKAGNMRKRK